MSNTAQIYLTVVEETPGQVRIGMFRGHGAEQESMLLNLSDYHMKVLHEALTRALWERL
jgi:hypothetical protein